MVRCVDICMVDLVWEEGLIGLVGGTSVRAPLIARQPQTRAQDHSVTTTPSFVPHYPRLARNPPKDFRGKPPRTAEDCPSVEQASAARAISRLYVCSVVCGVECPVADPLPLVRSRKNTISPHREIR